MSNVYSSQQSFRDRTLERLRLQFLEAGNWKAALADSGLPDDVKNILREVVQQTGLLRFEKSEIITELIHHFQDGRDRGHSFEELVRDFGNTDVAVTLFRSSKIRSRPMSIKIFRSSLVAFCGGLISYLLLQLFFHSAMPNPTVDYSAKLNEAVTSMPVEEQAWPLYRDVWVKHGFVEDGSRYKELWFSETGRDTFDRLIRPTDKGWEKAVSKLESLEELLEVLREGSKLPFLGTPLHVDRSKYSDRDLAALFPGLTREKIIEIDSSGGVVERLGQPISKEADELISESVVTVQLPHIVQFRRAARLLRVDTRYAMQQGDHDRAIENVETIFGLGKQTANNPVVVCTLVGLAVQDIGFDVIEELTDEHLESLSNVELKRLQKLVANVDFSSTFTALSLSSEKYTILDLIQRIYSDDGNGDGRMTAVGMEVQYAFSKWVCTSGSDESWFNSPVVRSVAGPASLFTALSRKEMESLVNEVFEELDKTAQLTMWQKSESDFDLEEFLKDKDESGFLLGMMGAHYCFLDLSREVKIARQDGALLALAIHRFKRSQGEWPSKMDQLVGKWIDRTPVDRINGKPLHFVFKDDAPIVYSIGHDGDDDGGVGTDSDTPWLDHDSEGDWILWPQED